MQLADWPVNRYASGSCHTSKNGRTPQTTNTTHDRHHKRWAPNKDPRPGPES